MADQPSLETPSIIEFEKAPLGKRLLEFPWWFVAIILIAIWASFIIFFNKHVFTTSAEFVTDSDIDPTSDPEATQIYNQLREDFAEEGITLSRGAVLEVITLDQKWRISDGNTTYFLIRDSDELDVYQRGQLYFNKKLLFTTKTEFVKTSQISEQLTEVFLEQDLELGKKAYIVVKRPDQRWYLDDGLGAYYLVRDGENLDVSQRGRYGDAFDFIKAGLSITIEVSLKAYGIAILLGLLAGLGRISTNIIFSNLSRLYVELIRGIPMLVLIFFIALVGVPVVVPVVADRRGIEPDPPGKHRDEQDRCQRDQPGKPLTRL